MTRLLRQPSLVQLLNAADRDMYKNKWLRKNPGRTSDGAGYVEGRIPSC